MRLRSLAALAAPLALACGSSRPPTPPAVDLAAGGAPVRADGGDVGEVVVWGQEGGGPSVTYRLAADGSGRVTGEERGVVILTSRGELSWVEETREVKLAGCGDVEEEEEEAERPPPTVFPFTGRLSAAYLLSRDGQGRQEVVDTSSYEGDTVQDLQHDVELLGSVGPYLFVHESTFIDACGLHGHTTASFLVWDAEAGKQVDLLTKLPRTKELALHAAKKLDEEEPEPEANAPDPVQVLPVYSARGGLRLDAQFARAACYACSDGLWTSYSRSAIVPSEWVPEVLAPWAMPPVSVVKFLQEHPRFVIRGWSSRQPG